VTDPRALLPLLELAEAAERMGELERAVAAWRDLCAAAPRDAALALRLGLAEYALGDLRSAEAALARAAKLDRRSAAPLVNLGLVQNAAGRHAEAAATLRRAVALAPGLAVAHLNLALALSAAGEHRAAVDSARRACALAPGDAEAQALRGNVLHAAGDLPAAEAAWREALALGAPAAGPLHNLATAALARDRVEDALAGYRAALAADPGYAPARVNLGNLLQRQRDLDGAEAEFARVVEHSAQWPGPALEARYNLANLWRMTGRLHEAIEGYRAVLQAQPDHPGAGSNLLLTMNYADLPREALHAAHMEVGGRLSARARAGPVAVRAGADDRRAGVRGVHAHARIPGVDAGASADPIRIGFVSPDLRDHVVARYVEPLFEHLPAHGFEVTAYSNHARPDAVTARLRARASRWRDVVALGDDALQETIARDRIDILVDLAGHTDGHRLAVFARRAARLQVTMIGHINTTGVPAMDARVTDRWVEPEGGDHDRWYAERLLRLPSPFSAWCFRPPPETLQEPVSATPALGGEPFTLASFNNWAKVGERVLDLWIRLLQALPQSRLLLAAVPEGSARARLQARVAGAGIAPERLEIHGPLPPAAFRALHARADLALDPFPCNGGTTTVDTLWTGVPVLALEGEGYRSRAAAGILQAAGLDGLIAADEDGYLERAVALAADPAALDRLRRSLRDRLAASPLRDEAGHAAALAGLLREALAGVDRS